MPVRTSFHWVAVSALAIASSLVTSAGAAVITRTYNQNLDNGNFNTFTSLTTNFDFNLDGHSDFAFTHVTGTPGPSPTSPTDYNGRLLMDSGTPSQFLAVVKDFDTNTPRGQTSPIGNYAETLKPGFLVGGNALSGFIQISPGGATAYDDALLNSSGTGNGGAFSVATGERDPLDGNVPVYVGFAFGSITNPNYGYLVFTNIGNDDRYLEGDRNAATLQSIVYESTPGKPLAIPAVPEPVSLATVALAGAILTRRRRA